MTIDGFAGAVVPVGAVDADVRARHERVAQSADPARVDHEPGCAMSDWTRGR